MAELSNLVREHRIGEGVKISYEGKFLQVILLSRTRKTGGNFGIMGFDGVSHEEFVEFGQGYPLAPGKIALRTWEEQPRSSQRVKVDYSFPLDYKIEDIS